MPRPTLTLKFDVASAAKAYVKAQMIEPKIRSLVDALNSTKLVKTWSSCQGHFHSDNPTAQWAHVHFEKLPGTHPETLDCFLRYLAAYVGENNDALINVTARYTPWRRKPSYSISILPSCSTTDSPRLKRKLTDKGIQAATEIVYKAMKPEEKSSFASKAARERKEQDRLAYAYQKKITEYLDPNNKAAHDKAKKFNKSAFNKKVKEHLNRGKKSPPTPSTASS